MDCYGVARAASIRLEFNQFYLYKGPAVQLTEGTMRDEGAVNGPQGA